MVLISPEQPDDAEEIARVHVRSWQIGYANLMPATVLDQLDPAAWAQRRRTLRTTDPDQPFTTLVARSPDRLTGFVTFGPYRVNGDRADLDPAYGEILALYVDPAYWGVGIGRRLVTEALDGLVRRGWRQVRLWVLAGNLRARRCYERAGLIPDGSQSHYRLQPPDGPPLDLPEVRYAGRLTSPPPGRAAGADPGASDAGGDRLRG